MGSTPGYSWCCPAGSTERSNLFESHWSNRWLTLRTVSVSQLRPLNLAIIHPYGDRVVLLLGLSIRFQRFAFMILPENCSAPHPKNRLEGFLFLNSGKFRRILLLGSLGCLNGLMKRSSNADRRFCGLRLFIHRQAAESRKARHSALHLPIENRTSKIEKLTAREAFFRPTYLDPWGIHWRPSEPIACRPSEQRAASRSGLARLARASRRVSAPESAG